MNPTPATLEVPEPVLLVIADISGYTRYMTANAKTLGHSQTIITELIKTLIRQVELPLEVAKLEGDAVFLYCRKVAAEQAGMAHRKMIGDKLIVFFEAFRQKVGELSRSTTCTCNACTHIEKLRLKVVVHSGTALFHRIFNFVELAGVDVILVHRLLKNSVAADQYLLLTEAARQDLAFPATVQLRPGRESYDELGRINTLVYLPDAEAGPLAASAPGRVPAGVRFARAWNLFCQLWFAPFASRTRPFRHLETGVTPWGRLGFALGTALLTPLMLPVGTFFVLLQAGKAPAAVSPAHPEPGHKADGSCCGGDH